MDALVAELLNQLRDAARARALRKRDRGHEEQLSARHGGDSRPERPSQRRDDFFRATLPINASFCVRVSCLTAYSRANAFPSDRNASRYTRRTGRRLAV